MSIKITLDASALSELIKGDEEMKLVIRSGCLAEVSNRFVKPILEYEARQAIKSYTNEVLEGILIKKTKQGFNRTTYILPDKIKQAIKSEIDSEYFSLIRGESNKIKKAMEARIDTLRQDYIDNIESHVNKLLNNAVMSKALRKIEDKITKAVNKK